MEQCGALDSLLECLPKLEYHKECKTDYSVSFAQSFVWVDWRFTAHFVQTPVVENYPLCLLWVAKRVLHMQANELLMIMLIRHQIMSRIKRHHNRATAAGLLRTA